MGLSFLCFVGIFINALNNVQYCSHFRCQNLSSKLNMIRIPGEDDDGDNNGRGDHNPQQKRPSSTSSSAKASSTTKRPNNLKTFEELETPLPNPICRLRLEAIFHPKFENEKSDGQIRQDMLDRVSKKQGYLEVSLKHSGCLILWSGGQRFYSKNSTDNQFTSVAEIILLQHFERSWRQDDTNNESNNDQLLSKYYECSKYVEEHRLTLAFELVTSVLGDHGDKPKRDFMMLTAVASKAQERFYTTVEVMQFAHQFRLPHNDTWMFSSLESSKSLFHFYDTSMETAMASDTVKVLDQLAEVSVPSMYPHVDFQGEILEGYIVRYVPYPASKNESAADTTIKLLTEVSKEAKTIVKQHIPSNLPASFEVESIINEKVPCLSVNIRTLFQDVQGPTLGLAASTKFAEVLNLELGKNVPGGGGGPKRRKIERVDGKHVDLPALTEALTKSNDKETRRIATLLQNLIPFQKSVSYGFLQEEDEQQQQSTTTKATTEQQKHIRHLCIIHILYDEAFIKFQKKMEPGDMALFRGFSIELSGGSEGLQKGDRNLDGVAALQIEDIGIANNTEGSLMLKKKLLPYMVRTFICRNGLSLVQNKGPCAFMSNAVKLLNRWGISQAGKEKWIPFFEAWADYAELCFQNGGTTSDPSLPKLSSFSYLSHLEHFTKLYELGEIKATTAKSSFRGMVFILSPSKSNAEKIAKCFAKSLDGASMRDIHDVAKRSIMRGCVSYGGLADASKPIKKHLFEVSDYTTIVLFGCSNDEIEIQLLEEASNSKKKLIGLRKFWSKTECALRMELPLSLLSDLGTIEEASAYKEAVEKIKAMSTSTEGESSSITGVLAYFPQIPGCGKSTTVSTFESDFHEFYATKMKETNSEDSELKRKVVVRVGDKLQGSYWPQIKKDLRKDSSSILITDKNAPPPSWRTVSDLCSDSNVVPVAILPDKLALQTTTVKGIRKPDNEFSDNPTHVYPFSLLYLAVCIARVLERKAKSHAGKLDCSSPTACMIVVMFFSLYRQVSAEDFKDAIKMKVGGALSQEQLLPPIEVPFFDASEPIRVPSEVQDVLIEALQLQVSSPLLSSALCTVMSKLTQTFATVRIRQNQDQSEAIGRKCAGHGETPSRGYR